MKVDIPMMGYENYAYMHHRDIECRLFILEGFDGSRINTYKLYEWYNTPKDEALPRVESYIKDFPDRELNIITGGIGNHGGGSSKKNLNDNNNFAKECKDIDFVHSALDSYFNELDKENLEVTLYGRLLYHSVKSEGRSPKPRKPP